MRFRRLIFSGSLALAAVLLACAGPSSPRAARDGAPDAQRTGPPRTKTLTVAVSAATQPFSLLGESRPTGGWLTLTEVHSDGLVTADAQSRRLIGRLAERAPTLEGGDLSVLPDGRMRVAFSLKKGITWHDGVPFSAQDLVFSYRVGGPGGIPSALNQTAKFWQSVEAPDASTFIVYYERPHYQGTMVGPAAFWPLPRHLLEDAYNRSVATGEIDAFLNHPFWTTDYVHLGAFSLSRFDPGEGLTLAAYPGYFLGRAKIDVIRVRVSTDANAVFTGLLAGEIDLLPNAVIRGEIGSQLKEQWKAGTVHVKGASVQQVGAQLRPWVQAEPANLDPRVRRALYHALDREALSDGVNGGNPQLATSSFVERDDALYPATQDTFREFVFAPDRARAILRDLGWTSGGDGVLRHGSDGRPYRTVLWGTAGFEHVSAAVAGYWRQIGLDIEEFVPPAARARDREYRATFPGWDSTGTDLLDLMSERAATADNRWLGNANGFEDPAAQRLVATLTASLDERSQVEAARRIGEYAVANLPTLPLFYFASYVGNRAGVRAYDDLDGGSADWRYGSFSRNAYLWDVD